MNGIIVGMAGLLGMDGSCLLGETSGYLVDPIASQLVLEALSRVMKLKIELGKLSERAIEAKQVMGDIRTMTEQGTEPGGSQRTGQPGYIG